MNETAEPGRETAHASSPDAGAGSDEKPPSSRPGLPGVDFQAAHEAATDAMLAWLVDALSRVMQTPSFEADLARLGSVSVLIVDDAEMRRLHERHLGEPVTTDVLSFDLAEPGAPIEAEIVLCLDEARRRAAAMGHKPRQELLLYILHGILHTLGHDDLDEHAAGAMHEREDALLEEAGMGRLYTGMAPGRGRA